MATSETGVGRGGVQGGRGLLHAGLAALLLPLAAGLRADFVDESAARLPASTRDFRRVVVGDLDGDGHPDLLLVGKGRWQLLRNDGDGVFTEMATVPLAEPVGNFVDAALVDANGNGHLDIVLIAYRRHNRLLLNDGSGAFAEAPAGHMPSAIHQHLNVAVGDVDGDGRPDLAIATGDAGIRLLRNDGDDFVDVTAARLPVLNPPATSLALLDTTASGVLDLFVAGRQGRHRLLRNNGLGFFSEAPAATLPAALPATWHARTADLDGDGFVDLILAAGSEGTRLLRNDGLGNFIDETADRLPELDAYVIDVAVGDVNVNGHPDLLLVCPGQNRLLLNDGDGRFTDATAAMLPVDLERTYGAAFVDIDQDLDPDLVLAHPDGGTRLWRNAMPEPRVRVSVTPFLVEVGSPARIAVQAADDDAIVALDATVNGIPIILTDRQADFIPAAPGPHLVVATARNLAGLNTTRSAAFEAVANLAPVVDAGPNAGIFLGQTFTGSGSFSDTGDGPWTATVDYGDGSGVQPLALNPDKTFALEHTYHTFGTFTVTVRVFDGMDEGADTALVAVLNQPPVLSPIPGQVVQEPAPFAPIHLDAYVHDPDHDDEQIAWTVAGNLELQVEIDGERITRITYAPGARVSETLTFTATDPMGGTASTTASFTVAEPSEDYIRPAVSITLDPEVAAPGEAVVIAVTVTDESPIMALELTVAGLPLALDTDRRAVFVSPAPGVFAVRATAMDAAGNTGHAQAEIAILVPGDTTTPVVDILTPEDMTEVVGPTTITGTASDANLMRYTLAYAPAGETRFVTFATGTASVLGGILGVFDGTTLRNGLYTVRLEAVDHSGNTSRTERTYRVTEDRKVGVFQFQVVDLAIPAMGIDLEVIRAYGSDNKGSGDFGVGWTLTMSDVQLHVSGVMGEDWHMTQGGGFTPYALQETKPHYVAVVLPNGRTNLFGLRINPQTNLFLPYWDATASFQPEPGTHSTLVALGDNLLQVEPGPGNVTLWRWGFSGIYDPQRYRLTTREGFAYVVDRQNGLESLADRHGNTVTFGPEGMTHSGGRSIAFERDAKGRITRITDPRGGSLHYRYDFYGDLVEFEDQLGRVTRYIYNDRHEMIDIIGPSGTRSARNLYDDEGRLIAIIDENGNRTEYLRDLDNRTETIVDPLGHSVRYEYDERGYVTAFTDELGNTSTMTYDERGNVLTETDPLGNTTTYAYDASGNRVGYTTPNGHIFTAAYDAQGRLASATDPLGNTTTVTRDASGNVTARTDALGNAVSWTYDANGNVLSETDPNGNTTSFEYSAKGDLTKVTDPLGHSVQFEYDASGNRTAIETTRTPTPDGAPQTLRATFEYDAANRLVSRQMPGGRAMAFDYAVTGYLSGVSTTAGDPLFAFTLDEAGAHTTILPGNRTVVREIDARGRVRRHTNLGGGSTTYDYDAGGRLQQATAPNGTVMAYGYDAASRITSFTPAPGRTTTYDYDPVGQLTHATDPLGNTRFFTYDGNLRPTGVTDELGATVTQEYDAAGRVTAVHAPDGTAETFTYDAAGRLTSRTDRGGRTTYFTYDARGRLTAIEDALGGVTAYTYDELGNLTGVTDAAGRTTTMEYNDRGQPIRRTLPGGATRTWTYDDGGRVTAFTDDAGRTRTYDYDQAGMLATIAYADGTADTMVHDGAGRVIERADDYGVNTFLFNPGGQLLRETNPDGQVVDYTFDAAGLIETVATAAGVTRYAYDANGRLATVTDPGGGVTAYTRDGRGAPVRIDYPNGTWGTAVYTVEGRLSFLEYRGPANQVLASFAYTWDAVGNVVRVVEADDRQVDYTYDALDRLVEERIAPHGGAPVETIAYTYDAVGNRLTRTDANGTLTYVYDQQDRLLSDGTRAFAYDDNGNLHLLDDGDGTLTTYTYDARNQLIGVHTAGPGGVRTLAFDYSAGRRIRTTVDGTEAVHHVTGGNGHLPRVLLDTDAAGVPNAAYTHGDTLLGMIPAGGGDPRTYHSDLNGSTRLLTGPAGTVTDTYDYDAFGQLRDRTGATLNPFLFAGEAAIPDAGLYDLRARYYAPELGRFISRDPLRGDPRRPETFHPYTYTANNPVTRIDPSGLDFNLASLSMTCKIISGLSMISFIAIGTDYHPFSLGVTRDGINDDNQRETNLIDRSFPGDWVQATSGLGFSVGGQSMAAGLAVARTLWSGPTVAVRHVTMDYGVQLSSSTGPYDLIAGMNSTTWFMDLIMALSEHSPQDWTAWGTTMLNTMGMVEGIIAQAQFFDLDPSVSLSLSFGIARVMGAKDSGKLDGLTASGNLGATAGSGAGLGFGLGFGINTDRETLFTVGPWNGVTVFSANTSAGIGTGSGGSSINIGFTLSLAFRWNRFK